MNRDYAYCNVNAECIHRYGCRRWIDNYPSKEIEEWSEGKTIMIDKKECLNEDDHIIDGVDDCGEPYEFGFRLLDRFRNSKERD